MFVLRKFKVKKPFTRFSSVLSEKEKKMRFAIELDKNFEKEIDGQQRKIRFHPGRLNVGTVHLPQPLIKVSKEILRDFSGKPLDDASLALAKKIWSRKLPVEGKELQDIIKDSRDKLIRRGKIPETDDEDEWTAAQKNALYSLLRKKIYNWKPLEYFSEFQSAVYLSSRLAPDYASLFRVFQEIKLKLPNFSPSTLFDFGSGVGSVIWALNSVWPMACKEAVFIDSSSFMNDLSRSLQEKGKCDQMCKLKEETTFYRQFLPSSVGLTYDLVVSSRSLFELGEIKDRIQTLDILWRKVKPGGCLVLVEAGTFAGYKMLLEARDYLIQITKMENKGNSGAVKFYIVAPCTHEKFCPRFSHESNRPCNFTVNYSPLFGEEVKTDLFSYVVFTKEERSVEPWPKVIDNVLIRHNHRIVRCCTSAGTLQEFAVTKKRHGKELYALCRNINLGDLFPVNITYEEMDTDDDLEVCPKEEGEKDLNFEKSDEPPKSS